MNTVGEPYSGKPNVRIDEGRPGEAVPNRAAYSTADSLCAPVRVLASHIGDPLADFGVQPRTSQPTARAPAPEEVPAPAVPAEHGLRPDQEQVASPVLVQAPNQEPKELVPSSEAWPPPGTEGNPELLAEKQVLDDKALTTAAGGYEGGQEEPDEFEHRGRIADPRSRRDCGHGLLPSYTQATSTPSLPPLGRVGR